MKRPKRTYEDYEELGQRLIAARQALFEVHTQLMQMYPFPRDAAGRPLPTGYDSDLLKRKNSLASLISQLALEYRSEAPDVPEGKPQIPPPFDRESGR